MAKITLQEETPSQHAIAKANETFNIVDAKGRTITLKKPGVLAQYRLIEALGDSAANQTYVSMVLPLIYISAIDGEVEIMPTAKLQVEALIQRLDEEGIAAVMKGVTEHFGQTDPERDKAAIKKS